MVQTYSTLPSTEDCSCVGGQIWDTCAQCASQPRTQVFLISPHLSFEDIVTDPYQ